MTKGTRLPEGWRGTRLPLGQAGASPICFGISGEGRMVRIASLSRRFETFAPRSPAKVPQLYPSPRDATAMITPAATIMAMPRIDKGVSTSPQMAQDHSAEAGRMTYSNTATLVAAAI